MKSKLLQLQSSKSKWSSKNFENYKKKPTAPNVLCVFYGNVSGVVLMVAGWREMYLLDFWGNTCSVIFFSNERYQSEYHCYSKCLALFCLEALDISCLRPPLDSQSVSEWVGASGWGGGVSTECLSAVVLWVAGGITSSFTCLSFWQGNSTSLRGWPIMASRHTRHLWRGSTVPPPHPPPTTSQFFDTKITLAGTCNSHISGIFASVIFYDLLFLDFIFVSMCVYMQWYTEILAAELALHCSYAETLWLEVPLYVHPVYWMQNEDQYYRPLSIVYLLELLMLCVWQYSVVLPGSYLEMCKTRMSRTGLWLFVAPRCSTCPQAVPSLPFAKLLRYNLLLLLLPDPVASPPSGTHRPSYLFLCKRLEARAFYSMPNPIWEKALSSLSLAIPNA